MMRDFFRKPNTLHLKFRSTATRGHIARRVDASRRDGRRGGGSGSKNVEIYLRIKPTPRVAPLRDRHGASSRLGGSATLGTSRRWTSAFGVFRRLVSRRLGVARPTRHSPVSIVSPAPPVSHPRALRARRARTCATSTSPATSTPGTSTTRATSSRFASTASSAPTPSRTRCSRDAPSVPSSAPSTVSTARCSPTARPAAARRSPSPAAPSDVDRGIIPRHLATLLRDLQARRRAILRPRLVRRGVQQPGVRSPRPRPRDQGAGGPSEGHPPGGRGGKCPMVNCSVHVRRRRRTRSTSSSWATPTAPSPRPQ